MTSAMLPGQTVPWVTLRAGEKQADIDRIASDHYGIRWIELESTFAGTPLFADLHPVRQRRSMDELRCQVCGHAITDTAHWIVPQAWLTSPDGMTRPKLVTPHPPVCAACRDQAVAQCPHLRVGRWCAVTHHRVTAWGVRGTAVPVAGLPISGITVDNDTARRTRVVANQRIVALDGWSVSDEW